MYPSFPIGGSCQLVRGPGVSAGAVWGQGLSTKCVRVAWHLVVVPEERQEGQDRSLLRVLFGKPWANRAPVTFLSEF